MFSDHHDPDGDTVELFTQLDVVLDEARGHWAPRPWHESFPISPRSWEVDAAAKAWDPLAPMAETAE